MAAKKKPQRPTDPHLAADWSAMYLNQNYPGPYENLWNDYKLPQAQRQEYADISTDNVSPGGVPSSASGYALRALQPTYRQAEQLFGPDLFTHGLQAPAQPQPATVPADPWKSLTIPSPSEVWRNKQLAGPDTMPPAPAPQAPASAPSPSEVWRSQQLAGPDTQLGGYDPQKMLAKVNDAIMRLPGKSQPQYDAGADDRTTPADSPIPNAPDIWRSQQLAGPDTQLGGYDPTAQPLSVPSPAEAWRSQQLAGDNRSYAAPPPFAATASGVIGGALSPSQAAARQPQQSLAGTDSPYLGNQIDAAQQQAAVTPEEQRALFRAIGQVSGVEKQRRAALAKAIASGQVDAATIKPEDVPWENFTVVGGLGILPNGRSAVTDPGPVFHQLADIAIRDPVKAHALLVAYTKSAQSLEGARNFNPPSFVQGAVSGLTKPSYQELPPGRTSGEAWGQHAGTAAQEILQFMAMGKAGLPAAGEAQATQFAKNASPVLGKAGPVLQKLAPGIGRGLATFGTTAALRLGANNTIQEKGPDQAAKQFLSEAAMGPLFEGAGEFVGGPVSKLVSGAPGVRNLSPAMRTLAGEAAAGTAVGASVGGVSTAAQLAGTAIDKGGLTQEDLKQAGTNFLMTTGELAVLHFVNALPKAASMRGYSDVGQGTGVYQKGSTGGDGPIAKGDLVRWQQVRANLGTAPEVRGTVTSEPDANGYVTVKVEGGGTSRVPQAQLSKASTVEFMVEPLTPENAKARIAFIAQNGDSMPDAARVMNHPDLVRVASGQSAKGLYENRNVRPDGQRPGQQAAQRVNDRIAAQGEPGTMPEPAQFTRQPGKPLDFGLGSRPLESASARGGIDFGAGARPVEGQSGPVKFQGMPVTNRVVMFQHGQQESPPITFGPGSRPAKQSSISSGSADQFMFDTAAGRYTFEGAKAANPSNAQRIDSFLRANDRANARFKATVEEELKAAGNKNPAQTMQMIADGKVDQLPPRVQEIVQRASDLRLPDKVVEGFTKWAKESGYTGGLHDYGPGAKDLNGVAIPPQDIQRFDTTGNQRGQRPVSAEASGPRASAPARPPIDFGGGARPVEGRTAGPVDSFTTNTATSKPVEKAPEPLKEFWQMTRAKYVNDAMQGNSDDPRRRGQFEDLHRRFVTNALMDGKAVPADVLADYPDVVESVRKKQAPAQGKSIDQELHDRAASKSAAFEAINPQQDGARIHQLLQDYTASASDKQGRRAVLQQLDQYAQGMGYDGWPEAAQELFNTDDPTLKHFTLDDIQTGLQINKDLPPGDVMNHRAQQVTTPPKSANNVKGEVKASDGGQSAVPPVAVGAPGPGSLETAPTEDGQGTPADGKAPGNAVLRPGADEAGVRGPAPGGGLQQPGLGNGEGEVSPPAGREGRAEAVPGTVSVNVNGDIKNILEKRNGDQWHVKDDVHTIHVAEAEFSQNALDRLLEATVRGKFTKQEHDNGVTFVRPGAPVPQTTPPAPATQQGSLPAPDQTAPAPPEQIKSAGGFSVGDTVTATIGNREFTGRITGFKPMGSGHQAIIDTNLGEMEVRTEHVKKQTKQSAPAPDASGQTLTVPEVHDRLQKDQRFLEHAIVHVYKGQTDDEQQAGSTHHQNGIGFNGVDAQFMTSLAQQIQAGRSLSPKQADSARKIMTKYAKQITSMEAPPFQQDAPPTAPQQSSIQKGREIGPPAVGSSGQTIVAEFRQDWGRSKAGTLVAGVVQEVKRVKAKKGNAMYTNAEIQQEDGTVITVPVSANYVRFFAGEGEATPQTTAPPPSRPPLSAPEPPPQRYNQPVLVMSPFDLWNTMVNGKVKDTVDLVIFTANSEFDEETANAFNRATLIEGWKEYDLPNDLGGVISRTALTPEHLQAIAGAVKGHSEMAAAQDDSGVLGLSDGTDDWDAGPTVSTSAHFKGWKGMTQLRQMTARVVAQEQEAEQKADQVKQQQEAEQRAKAAEAKRKKAEESWGGASNYTITGTEGIAQGGDQARFNANYAAIKLLKELEAEGRAPNTEEQAILVKFTGWGGIPNAVDDRSRNAKSDWYHQYNSLKALLTPDEWRDAQASTTNAHYTSIPIIRAIWGALKAAGFQGGRVLEPSMGVGLFYGAMPVDLRGNSQLQGVELDAITGRIAQMLMPKAHISIDGFQNVAFPDDSLDLVISNVPFDNATKPVDANYNHLKPSLHNYFFLKALDKVRPGGVVVFITSAFTMDAQDRRVREALAGKADLITAIRLPNTAFKDNARTTVVTDLIVLRKRDEAQERAAVKWSAAGHYIRPMVEGQNRNGKKVMVEGPWTPQAPAVPGMNGEAVPVNEYFASHPENIIGTIANDGSMYHRDPNNSPPEMTVHFLGASIENHLSEVLARSLPTDLFQPSKDSQRANADAQLDEMFPAPGNYPVGSFYVEGTKLLQKNKDGMGVPVKSDEAARIKAMAVLRDAAMQTLRAYADSRSAPEDIEAARTELNQRYDAFQKQHGFLHDLANIKAFMEDPMSHLLRSLEDNYKPEERDKKTKQVVVAATADKAPIFRERIVKPFERATTAANAQAALLLSLVETGKVHPPRMEELLGKPFAEIVKELNSGATPLVFNDPEKGYVTADEYLSGNVRHKLRVAQQALNGDKIHPEGDQSLAANVAALEAALPPSVPFEKISVTLTSPWLEGDTLTDFMADLLDVNRLGITVTKHDQTGTYTLTHGKAALAADNNVVTWATSRVTAIELVRALLRRKYFVVKDPVPGPNGGYIMVRNDAQTQLAREKADAISAEFVRWIRESPRWSAYYTTKYNDLINNIKLREFNGDHLTMPGADPTWASNLRPHQKRAIWRALQSKRALFAHAVGSGKSLEMAGAIMEGKRMGLWHKSLMIVPNHMAGDAHKQFSQLYPAARIHVGTRGMNANQRKHFIAQIATGQWDAVILPESMLTFIPMSKETTRAFYQEQLDQLEQAIQENRAARGKDDATVKELAKAKRRLETKMNRLLAQKRKDTNVDFETLGIDCIVVDEAHRFKNLFYATGRQNLKGLNNQAGSAKAFDLFMKFRWIQRNGGGTMMATGTPIANSMAEMFHMMRYLIPEQLEDLGLTSFDKWADAFGTIVNGVEKNVDGRYTVTDRFKQFINAPELLKLFRDFADVITLKELAADFKANPNIDYPSLLNETDGSETRTHIVVPASLEMQNFFADIVARAEAVHGGQVLPTEDNYLKITTDGRKAATDLRLVNKGSADEPNSKINIATKEIHKRWVKHTDRKGTQIVFMDMGTPKRKAETDDTTAPVPKLDIPDAAIKSIATLILDAYDKFGEATPEGERMLASAARQLAGYGAFDGNPEAEGWHIASEIADPIMDSGGDNWGQKAVMNQIKRVIGAALGVDETEDQDTLVLYADMRQKLAAQGIPVAEIAFIHEYKSDAAKMDLFRKVNAGDIRVLIGSTETMGVGMNVQEKVVAIHHLDAPWKPADIEQREGRGLRQGNKMGTLEVVAYTTEGSLDEMLWDTLKHKAEFIGQAMSGNLHERTLTEIDENVLGFQGISAATSGDKRRLRHFNLTNEVRNLENMRIGYDEQKAQMQAQRGQYLQTRKSMEASAKDDDMLADIIKGTRKDKFAMTIGKEEYGKDQRKEAAVALAGLIKEYSDQAKTTQDNVGHLGGLDVWLSAPTGGSRPFVYLIPPGAKVTKGFIFDASAYSTQASDSPQGTLSTLENYINDGFKDNAAEHAKTIKEIDSRVASIDKLLGKNGFPRAQELATKRTELIDLSKELKLPLTGLAMDDTALTNDYSDDNGDDDPDALAAEEEVLDEVLGLRSGKNRTVKRGSARAMKRLQELQQAAAKEQRTLSPMAASYIADRLAVATDAAIRVGTPLKGTEGHFVEKAGGKTPRTPGTVMVKPRSEFNWRIVGHELGHALQKFIGWRPRQSEMEAVARKFYPDQKALAKLSPERRNKEGFAEFFHIWMVDPQNADLQQLAKQTLAEFDAHIAEHPQLMKAMIKARLAASADFQNSDLLRVSGASVLGTDAVSNPALGEYELSGVKALAFQNVDFTIPGADFDKDAGSYVAKLQVLHGHAMEQAHLAITAHARDRQGRFITSGATLEQIAQKGIDDIAKQLNIGVIKRVKGPDGRQYTALHLFNYLVTARMIKMRYESGHEGFEKGKGLPLTWKEAVAAEEWAKQHLGKSVIDTAKQWSQALNDIRFAIYKDAGMVDDATIKHITDVSDPSAYMPSYPVHQRRRRGIGSVVQRSFRGIRHYKAGTDALWDFMTAAKLSIAEAYQSAGLKEILNQLEIGLKGEGMAGFGTIIQDRGRTAVSISKQQLADRAIKLLAGHLKIPKKDVKAAAAAAAQAAGKGWVEFWQDKHGLEEFQGMPVVMNRHFIDGKLVEVPMALAPDLFESIQAMQPIEVTAMMRFWAGFNRVFRFTQLIKPVTQGNIAVRDVTASTLQTKGNLLNHLGNLLNAVAVTTGLPVPTHKQLRDLYAQAGGFGGVEGGRVKGIKTVSALPPGLRKLKGGLVWVIDRPGAMMHFFETYPRLAEFMTVVKQELKALGDKTPSNTLKLIAAGQIDQLPPQIQDAVRKIMVEGAYASHQATANPGLHGASQRSRAFQASVPFLQGSIQGTYRFVMELADVTEAAKQVVKLKGGPDPKQRLKHLGRISSFVLRIFLTLVLPSLTSWYAMHRNKKDAAWLADLPSEMRDRYHWYPNSTTGGYIAVAKPYEYAMINNLLERYLDSTAGEQRTDWGTMLGTSFSFEVFHPLLKTALGLKYNRDSFGSPINPDSEKNLPTQEQAGPKTSGTAVALSKLYFNITDDIYAGPSPRQIDFALTQGGGGAGSLLLWLSDKVGGFDQTSTGLSGAEKDIVAFISSPIRGRNWYDGGSRIVDRFYTDYAQNQRLTGTLENWQKNKDQPYGNWTGTEMKKVVMVSAYKSIADDMSMLRKAMALMLKDAKTPEERMQVQSLGAYLQRTAAGIPYGVETPVPAGVPPEAGAKWQELLLTNALKAVNGEVSRQGGATDAAVWVAHELHKQAGGK